MLLLAGNTRLNHHRWQRTLSRSLPSPYQFLFSSFDLGAGRRNEYRLGTGVVSLITRSLLIVFNFQPLSRWPSTHPVCPAAYVVRSFFNPSRSNVFRQRNESIIEPVTVCFSFRADYSFPNSIPAPLLHHTSFLEHLVGTSYREILSKSYTFKFKPR